MRYLIFAALLLVPTAYADVVINGTRYQTDEVRITFTEKSDTSAPTPTPTPKPKPEPVDPPSTSEDIDWASPGGRQSLRTGDETLTYSFRTTSNPQYSGKLNLAETTGNENITRRIWISDEPRGDPTTPRCVARGVSAISFTWMQREYSIPRVFCELDTNTQYYLNIRQLDCQDRRGCSFYFSPLTNGKP